MTIKEFEEFERSVPPLDFDMYQVLYDSGGITGQGITCSTVGCIAGHFLVYKLGAPSALSLVKTQNSWIKIRTIALDLMGIKPEDRCDLSDCLDVGRWPAPKEIAYTAAQPITRKALAFNFLRETLTKLGYLKENPDGTEEGR